jgi:hypothetical protein
VESLPKGIGFLFFCVAFNVSLPIVFGAHDLLIDRANYWSVGEWAANTLHCARINTEPRCNLATQLFGATE